MKELICFKTSYFSHQLIATVFFKKTGLIIDITGPNDHLGGIGIGVPYIRNNGEESANYHCLSLPHHRDGELAGRMSRSIAKITRYYTVVMLGIHFPEVSKNQLKDIIKFFEAWAVDIGRQLVTDTSLNLNKPE